MRTPPHPRTRAISAPKSPPPIRPCPNTAPRGAVCAPGYGLVGTGTTCQACPIGAWSAGGNATVSMPPCNPCATGWTTFITRRSSPFWCNSEPPGLWGLLGAGQPVSSVAAAASCCALLRKPVPAPLYRPPPRPPTALHPTACPAPATGLPARLWRRPVPPLLLGQLVGRRQRDRQATGLHALRPRPRHRGFRLNRLWHMHQ